MICLPAAKFLFRPQTAAAWSPAALPLYGWYKADAGISVTTDGTSVATWEDQSGNGNNLAQTTSANQPTFRTASNGINGKPVLEFIRSASASASQFYLNTGFTGGSGTGFSFYIVTRTDPRDTGYSFAGSFAIGDVSQNGTVNHRTNLYGGDLSSETIMIPGSTEFSFAATTSNYKVIKVSCGTSKDTVKAAATYNAQVQQPAATNYAMSNGFRIGSSINGSCGSKIAEVIVCNRELTTGVDSEESKLDSYFRSRYGFGLYYGVDLPVTGAALWLDASRMDSIYAESTLATPVTADNGPVGGWKDLTSNARHALQISSTNRPTWRRPLNGQNGLGVMSFNGSSGYFETSMSLNGLASFSIFLVARSATSGGWQSALRQQSGTQGFFVMPWTSSGAVSPRIILGYDGGTTTTNTVTLTNGVFNLLSFVRTSGVSNVANVNKVLGSTRSANTGSLAESVSLAIGRYPQPAAEYFSGSIAEILIYNRALSSSETTSVESYLSAKWGTP